LFLSLSQVYFQHFHPLCGCARLQFAVYCSVFLGGWVSLPRGLCWFIPGVAGGILHDTWCLPAWSDVSQAGLELPVAAFTMTEAEAAHLFSQYNKVWRSFLSTRGSVCRSLDSSWCLISAKGDSRVLARFLIHRAHSVCFCALVAILDPPLIYLEIHTSMNI
jgi:hypothetical protein